MNASVTQRRSSVASLLGVAVLACTATALAHADTAVHARPAHHNPVVHWNTVAGDAFAPTEGTNRMAQSRTLAILHVAMHDALNAIDHRYEFYLPGLPAAPQASPDAAVATAAREVLRALLPDQSALLEAEYARTLMALREGPARTAGIATGQAAAWAILNHRHGDGADGTAHPAYVPGTGSGEYQFTSPFDFAAQPGWGNVQPFVIDLHEHSVEGPQALGSEQSEIARFWYDDSPLGWSRIANAVVRQRGLDPWEAARAFALVHLAIADGFIAGFDARVASSCTERRPVHDDWPTCFAGPGSRSSGAPRRHRST